MEKITKGIKETYGFLLNLPPKGTKVKPSGFAFIQISEAYLTPFNPSFYSFLYKGKGS